MRLLLNPYLKLNLTRKSKRLLLSLLKCVGYYQQYGINSTRIIHGKSSHILSLDGTYFLTILELSFLLDRCISVPNYRKNKHLQLLDMNGEVITIKHYTRAYIHAFLSTNENLFKIYSQQYLTNCTKPS